MSKYDHLTPEQVENLRQTATNQIVQDCEQERSYLQDLVSSLVEKMEIDEMLDALSSDRGLLHLYMDFDPETGLDWPEEEGECPNCHNGTLEATEDNRLVCRGECGQFFKNIGEVF